MKATVTLEIEIKDDIAELYNNFIFNYDSKKEFLINQINCLNHNISMDEQMVYKNLHPSFENPDYKFYDDGYKQRVTKVEIKPSKVQTNMLYQIIVLCDNELEVLIQNLSEEDMQKQYTALCNKWYQSESLEKFKNSNKDDYDSFEIYDAYKTSENYFDGDDRANVIWEVM